MTLPSTVRSRPLLSAAVFAAVVAVALIAYRAGSPLLRERQPLINACQTALNYLTASTTATRTIASEGPVHGQDRTIVRLQYEFRNVFAGQRPGQLVCEFAIAPAGSAPVLLAIDIEGQVVDGELLAEINAVLGGEPPAVR
jgi:hypothetical protein